MPEEKKETIESNNDIQQEISSEDSNDPKVSPEIVIKAEEIKRLEEKEHYELEYFSKDTIIEENKQLGEDLKNIKDKVAKLQKDNVDSKNKFMHLQAEFENAQKRWNKNRQNLRIEYTASALKNFLPLYDSFKKAIDSANETEKTVLNSFYTQFMNVYKSYGAKPIPVKVGDSFDYTVHEALSSIENDDVPENSILEIIQDGFKYGKEVIRYAKVIISKKPKPPEPEPEEKKVEEEASEGQLQEEDITKQDEAEKKKHKEKKHKKHKKEEN
ncbi:MAG: nucleotide exchange factor GrpE [Candidatus Lokiarchaeota archaeon]|nr:nucleotide exchange factor GrpE [Candidatus Lokiarchaeota archaeon]